jgi:hypothetical protein
MVAEAEQLALGLLVTPAGVLPCHLLNRRADQVEGLPLRRGGVGDFLDLVVTDGDALAGEGGQVIEQAAEAGAKRQDDDLYSPLHDARCFGDFTSMSSASAFLWLQESNCCL